MTLTVIMLIFMASLFFGSIGTPLIRRLAIKAGFIAVPKANRAHTEPTALMGGLAIYGAAIAALLSITLIVTLYAGNIFRLREFAAIVVGASLMAAVGLWDDRKAMPPLLKLAAEFLPVIIIFSAGVRVRLTPFDSEILNTLFNFTLTTVWILFITNAINFMDNLDGTAIMTSATVSAIFLLIAVLNGQHLVSVLAAAILGASLGFARYNLPLPNASIFMGDSGSLFLGFLLAVLGIKLRIPSNTNLITWMVPVIALGLPIFDTFLVAVSRRRRKLSFLAGGVDHITHRMGRLGMNKLSVALAVGLMNGALGLTAIFITQAGFAEAYTVAVSLGMLALYVLWRLEFKASYRFRTGQPPLQSGAGK